MAELLWVLAGLVALLAFTGWLSQRLRLPSAIGYLLVGVMLPRSVTDDRLQQIVHLDEVAHIAVLMLLFFIGLELDLRTLRKVLHDTRVVSIFNILVPAVFIAAFARLFGWALQEAIVLGIALSLSSTIFGERLSAAPGFPNAARQRMLGVLLAEDVAAGALIAVIALMSGGQPGGTWFEPLTAIGILVVALAVLAAIALLVVPRFIDAMARIHSLELVILVSGALLLGFSAAADWAGSAELGAFLAGMAGAEAGSRFTIRNALSSLRSISLALFFFASGLIVDPVLALQQWPLVLACVGLVVVSKVLVHTPSAMAAGLGLVDALRVGFAMSPMGEFGLILVSAAVAGGIAHPALSATVTGAIVGLLIVSPMLMKAAPALARLAGRTPRAVTGPLRAVVQGMRRRKMAAARERPARGYARFLASLVFVVVVFAGTVAANDELHARLPSWNSLAITIAAFAAGLALAAPLLYQAFVGYRAIVQPLLAIPDRPGLADRLKLRVADAFAVMAALLLVLAVAAALGASWQVLAASLMVALVAAWVGWHQLSQLTRSLESSLARVLGSEADVPPTLLDEAIHRYGWDFRVFAVTLTPASSLLGQTIAQSRLRKATGATIAVIKRGTLEIVNPGIDERFRAGDTLVLVGDPSQLARAEALLGADEHSLRMAAESRAASVVDAEVEAGSWLLSPAGQERDLEAESGVTVVGAWHQGADHPVAWTGSTGIQAGDRVIAIGNPLQMQRLHELLRKPP